MAHHDFKRYVAPLCIAVAVSLPLSAAQAGPISSLFREATTIAKDFEQASHTARCGLLLLGSYVFDESASNVTMSNQHMAPHSYALEFAQDCTDFVFSWSSVLSTLRGLILRII